MPTRRDTDADASVVTHRSVSWSPDVRLTSLRARAGVVHVVRDDLLEGGTKQRAAVPFLADQLAAGTRSFVYASPFAGFAQVAMATACTALGARCTIVAEPAPAGGLHAFSLLARTHGADVVLASSFAEAQRIAEERASSRVMNVPLGLDCAGFKQHLRTELARQWLRVVREVGASPARLWLPVGSGTLLSVFRELLPRETEIVGVDVHVLPETDARIAAARALPGVTMRSAPQPFVEPARTAPPVPSNAHYDAKLWELIEGEACHGDVWWNVAR